MTTSISFHGITSMRVMSEPIPSSSGEAPFYVTRVYFCDKNGMESSVTAMHSNKPITLDGAEYMNFTKLAKTEPA